MEDCLAETEGFRFLSPTLNKIKDLAAVQGEVALPSMIPSWRQSKQREDMKRKFKVMIATLVIVIGTPLGLKIQDGMHSHWCDHPTRSPSIAAVESCKNESWLRTLKESFDSDGAGSSN